MTCAEENMVEIAWIDYELFTKEKYRDDVDSTNRKLAIVDLAYEFEDEYENVDWDESDEDYYIVIYEFAVEKLLKQFGNEEM